MSTTVWHVKRCPDAKFQLEWLKDTGQIDSKLLSIVGEGFSHQSGLQMPFIDKGHPTMWTVHHTRLLHEHVWNGPKRWEPHITNVSQYQAHMDDVAPEFGDIWKRIPSLEYTWVNRVHGDLTRENVLGDVFIDPGRAWGLVCRELDESKMMQSYFGWETAKYGWKRMEGELPFEITDTHRILYMSHLCRLLKHPRHPRQAFRWAGSEILRMGEYLR